jgi:PncC family amidohydrolase
MSGEVLNAPVIRLQKLLVSKGLHLGAAESCTGGMLGEQITAVSGSSDFFLGGVVSYDDSVKENVLGVPHDVIAQHGAVSAECALAMARGVLKLLSVDIAVSITGVAGPGGGTAAKPVGTTFISVIAPDEARVERFAWTGSRQENRRQSVEAALNLICDMVAGDNDD